tara:strand:+ start:47491 stop:48660 length:1170 start_codon:yes stop_codon:yes gene_type:complete
MYKNLNLFEKLLVLSILIMPYTLLRIGFVGVGEIIILSLFLYEFKIRKLNFKIKDFIFTKFWIFYIIISLLGFSYNVLFLNYKTGTIDGMLFDLSAYILVLLSCYTLESYQERIGMNFISIIKTIFYSSSFVLTALYFLSFFTPSLLGLPLLYNDKFAPLVNNLHQISMFIIFLPFIGLLVFENEKNLLIRLITVLFIIFLFKMGIETGSFKAYIGLFLGLFVYIFLKLLSFSKGRYKNSLLFISLALGILLLLINVDFIVNLITKIFIEEDINEGRVNLYSKAIKVGFTSPIIGLGAGAHILNGIKFWDAHQSLLTIFLQTGLIGLLAFFTLYIKMIKKYFKTIPFFAAFCAISIYILGGDIMRRLPIWILLFLLFYYNTIHKNRIKN